MYTKQVPFKDFRDNPRNQTVSFNLTESEVFELIPEFQRVFKWRESIDVPEIIELDPEEVRDFYKDFKEILLTAYGVPSDDGQHFRKSGRYEFEESALFNACMMLFVTEPEETGKLIDGIMPKGMEDLVKKADANLAKLEKSPDTEDKLRREIAELRQQVESSNTSTNGDTQPQA